MKRICGFTLIELLISLVIFSLVSIAALNSVNHMMRAREQQLKYHEVNQALDAAYAHIFQDMIWFIGNVQATQDSMSFERTQTSQALSKVTVTYQLNDNALIRKIDSRQIKLLDNVEQIQISWLLNNKSWVGAFDQSTLEEIPLLLRIQFDAPHLGEVTWLFAAPHL